MHNDYNGNSHISEFERDEVNRRIAAHSPHAAAAGPAAVSVVMILLLAAFSLFALLFFAVKAFLTRGAPKLWPGSAARALKLFLLYEFLFYLFTMLASWWYAFIYAISATLPIPQLFSWIALARFWLYQQINTQLLYSINVGQLEVHYLTLLCINSLSIIIWLLLAKTLATFQPHLKWFRFTDATGLRINWLRVMKVHMITSLLFWSVVMFFS